MFLIELRVEYTRSLRQLLMLTRLLDKIKYYQYPIFLTLCIGLISFISYNLGHINALEKSPIKIGKRGNLKAETNGLKADIYNAVTSNQQQATDNQKKLDTKVVVSKASSSKKYHYSWCASGKRIIAKNALWFNSATEAEKAGYTLAGNCIK